MWNRKLPALAGVLACVVAVGVSACGSERAGESTNTDQSQSQAKENALDSPVTFFRTGGVAGFRDTLVVGPDGTVTLEGGRDGAFECTIPQPMLGKIADAAGSIQLKASDVPPKYELRKDTMPDEMFTSVRFGGTEYDSAVADKDESLRQLFRLMHDLLDSAYAARDGGESTCG